jgi:PTH1 family peptidyl-tRNA hydrolase
MLLPVRFELHVNLGRRIAVFGVDRAADAVEALMADGLAAAQNVFHAG